MEIVIIVLVVALIILILWDIFKRRQIQDRQSDKLRQVMTDSVTKLVGDTLGKTTEVYGEVKQKLGELTQKTEEVRKVGESIASLEDLLRAPTLRGGVGELMLERLLAESGLPNSSYTLQYTFRSGDTVDAVVKLGENLVPIDSKFPREDFERMIAAESDDERKRLRRQFIRTIKKHIDDVTKYILPDEGTFDFALMYIPAENIYYETVLRGEHFTEESDIRKYFVEKRVFPVSPNSFYAYLQVIVLGLRGLHVEKTARDIIGRLGRLQSDIGDFEDAYKTLGTHLAHAVSKYSEAERKLASLRGKIDATGEIGAEEIPQLGTPDETVRE